MPSPAHLAALRAVHSGLDTGVAVERYLAGELSPGQSARGTLGRTRRDLVALAVRRRRTDLVSVLERAGRDPKLSAQRLQRALDDLERSRAPTPQITDSVEIWFEPRIARALHAHSIRTLADLTVRVPRLKGWWRKVEGLGATGARKVEALFAAHPELTRQARALVRFEHDELIPWERLSVPQELDGSRGAFRAPRRSCVLSARNDYEAVQTWLELQESDTTRRAYRKEAERLILWAILERGKALSSLTTEDAIAYRVFLRQPRPARRWTGPSMPRSSPQWRPFQGPLSARSASYALTVISALFRWLIEQRYLVANPFAGVRVKGAKAGDTTPSSRAFTEHEWTLIRPLADRLADAGWTTESAARLRFVLDFSYATGLRSGELIRARLGHISDDEAGNRWIAVVGKGHKAGRVAVPPSARLALDRYLAARGVAVSPAQWSASTPLIAGLADDGVGLTSSRLWTVVKRFFGQCAAVLEPVNTALAEKLRRASPHWMRHTHATHALGKGASLTTVRDNLRHASVSTTSAYLHTDEVRRARELAGAFGVAQRGTGRTKPGQTARKTNGSRKRRIHK
jgi:site-specific recombinase XerD